MPFSSTASTSEPLASKISRSSTEPIRAARCSGVTVGLGRPENRVRMSERPDKVIPSLRGPYLPRRVRLEHLGAVACSPTASDLASIPRPFGIQGPQNCHFWYASTIVLETFYQKPFYSSSSETDLVRSQVLSPPATCPTLALHRGTIFLELNPKP